MRLIDKDRLLKGSNHYWLEMENFGDIESIDVRFVEMAEEIKAIPVEWIEDWLKRMPKHSRLYAYKVWLRNAIRGMVKDWEKENEVG